MSKPKNMTPEEEAACRERRNAKRAERERVKYATNHEWRALKNAKRVQIERVKRATDPEWHERKKKQMKEWYERKKRQMSTDPVFWERRRVLSLEWKRLHRARENSNAALRYWEKHSHIEFMHLLETVSMIAKLAKNKPEPENGN